MNKFKQFYRKAPVLATLMLISFLVFVVLYLNLTIGLVEPYYIKGLIFGVPFLFFGLMYYLTVKSYMNPERTHFIAFILTIVFLIAFPLGFLYFSFDSATTITTDVRYYERALRLSHFPDKYTEVFPDKIPNSAKNVKFRFNYPFLQGGKELALKFETDSDTLNTYKEKFSREAKWIGRADDNDAKEHGIFIGTLSEFNSPTDSNPSSNYVIYDFFSEPSKIGDWNHGKRSFAAINEQTNTVIFDAEVW